jgi:hypothetical protein
MLKSILNNYFKETLQCKLYIIYILKIKTEFWLIFLQKNYLNQKIIFEPGVLLLLFFIVITSC